MKKPKFLLTKQGYYKNIGSKGLTSYEGYTLKRNRIDLMFYKTRKDILRRDLAKILLPIIIKISKQGGDGLNILDIGCGDGVILESLYDIVNTKKINVNLFGIDPDHLAFKKVRVPANLIKGKAEKMPFKDSFFDLVVSSQTIEHLTEKQVFKSNAEVYRILRTGGLYYIETPNPQSALAEAMKDDWWMYLSDHLFLYPPNALSQLLVKANFKNIMSSSRYEKDEQINEIQEAFARLFPSIKNWYLARIMMVCLRAYINIFNKGAVTTILVMK